MDLLPQDVEDEDAVISIDLNPPGIDVAQPETPDVLPDGKCSCETASNIEFSKARSHSSCGKPPKPYSEVCLKDAKKQVFKDGETFGVKGCVFIVSC